MKEDDAALVIRSDGEAFVLFAAKYDEAPDIPDHIYLIQGIGAVIQDDSLLDALRDLIDRAMGTDETLQ